jgi:hypothetical protein
MSLFAGADAPHPDAPVIGVGRDGAIAFGGAR